MKIIYGVAGEGLGHATRSRPIIERLQKKHEVQVIVSGNAYIFLKDKVKNVTEIHGLTIEYDNNIVNQTRTIIENIRKAKKLIGTNFLTAFKLIKKFKPDIIITDFESLSYAIGKILRIPIISVDNNHALTHLNIDKIKSGAQFLGTLVVDTRTPACDEYLITSFFRADIQREKIKIFPPVLREKIINAASEDGEHIIVYQTSTSFKKQLLEAFTKFPKEKFIVYGFNTYEKVLNTMFKEYSEDNFIEDLRKSKAVITNGGFTLITEALHLRKPVLSIPVKKHHEQEVNAHYIHKLGYGMKTNNFDENALKEFLTKIPKYRQNLNFYKTTTSEEIITYIESKIISLTMKHSNTPKSRRHCFNKSF